MITERDTGYAAVHWAFDDEVTRVFDDMLERSIPEYRTMRDAVVTISSRFIAAESLVLDLGTSRGEMIATLAQEHSGTSGIMWRGFEISPPMLDAARTRFQSNIANGSVEIITHDLRDGLDWQDADLITSILTIMFVPVECRQALLKGIYDSLKPGGGFIMVEKLLGHDANLDNIFTDAYYTFKSNSGYTVEEIDRKRLSLQGVLVPMTAQNNIDALKSAGFTSVDCFWRWMNFAGFIAIK